MPASECQCQTESVCAAYFDCSLHRRYASYKGKLALANAEICSWETIVISCCGNQPPWQDDPELQKVADFLNANHFLPQLHRGRHNVTPDKKNWLLSSALLCVLEVKMRTSIIVMGRLPSSELV